MTQSSEHSKPNTPFSIRFSQDEKDHLLREAGKLSLATHIRSKLFDEAQLKKARKPTRRVTQPISDAKTIAKALALLGRSEALANLKEIAHAAEIGALPVTPDLLQDLQNACSEIRELRADLIEALGLKSGAAQ